MDDGSSVTPPQTLAEVEDLVKRFYKPLPAPVHNRINEELIELQRSQDGWKLADDLMSSNDANVRFYAAATFTMKLNTVGHTLDAETAESIQMRLVSWLAQFVRQGERLVCKKLCSTLTVYFIRSPLHWRQPLLHAALSLFQGDAVSATMVEQSNATMADLLPRLSELQIGALLWFAEALAVEVAKVSDKDPALVHVHEEMERIVVDAATIMHWNLTRPAAYELKEETLRVYLNWVQYAQPMWPQKDGALQHLRDLITPAAQCLLVEETQAEALAAFRDIMETYTSFFEPHHVHLRLFSTITYEHLGPKLLMSLQDQGDDAELLVQFLTSFGCANVQEIVENPESQFSSVEILKLFLAVLQTPGHPGDDDMLSAQTIEFWNTYIEYANDWLGSQDEDDQVPAWVQHAKLVLHEVVELLWKKMQMPSSDVWKGWKDDEKNAFKEFRLDSTDVVLSIFVLRGKEMLQQLIYLLLKSLEDQQWRAVESALHCLNALADNVLEDASYEAMMADVFRSTLFADISDFDKPIPPKVRLTAIDMLGSFGSYIERHAEFLPDTLRFLFASLEKGGLSIGAARSIASLCSACRVNLTGELSAFLGQYQHFLKSATCEPYTKEKVISAIASIVQALKPEKAKVEPLMALLTNIRNDAAEARRYAGEGDMEMAELTGVCSLQCLASIGKAMQVPDDIPINIYDDDEHPSAKQSFWDSGEGQRVQEQITACFDVLSIVGSYGDAIEAACAVLKSGYTETEPGPFVLPPSVTVRFLEQCTVSTPQVETVISTAGTLITQHSRKDSRRIDAEARSIYHCIANFMQAIAHPKNDPSISTTCVDILTRLMPYYTHILISELNPFILDYTLQALSGQDHFPKRSACEFWTKLLKPQAAAQAQEISNHITQILDAYGPKFTLALVYQIGGLAWRSDIENVIEPLKALLMNTSNGQVWLRQALEGEEFPSDRVTGEDRRRFLSQVLSTRGDGRRLKELVRKFWAACQGTVVSY